MAILTLSNLSLAYGHYPLLNNVDFQISPGERVCVVGRNGAGKSTLFRVISDAAQPDDGEIWRSDTLRIAHLEQEVPEDASQTVYQVVSTGLGELGRLLNEYHNAVLQVEKGTPASLHALAQLQHRIDIADGWNIDQKVRSVLSRLSLSPNTPIAHCSGGVRRRVMLAQALVSEPGLLLLDEPTNHMDITAITWLEEFLLSFQGALMFITHDRTFLKHLATRIVELDRGNLTSFAGNYDYYLKRKAELLENEARANAKFDNELAAHETWLRQGIKARRTRNEGRVKKLEAMRRVRHQRLEVTGKVQFDVDAGDASGKRVVDLRHVSFSFDGHCIINDLSLRIMRGDRIGVIGPNGSGKSTLLKLILGELPPHSGQIIMGTKLDVAYFDQQRSQLDLDQTVRDNISEGRDYITINGRNRHVVGYLKDFLFPPQRIDAPVKILSGGERNRLLLARLFTRTANLLVLDEPTNDLDVDTLELLEELLSDYEGTLLLVSHDRTFLDNVVTSTLVFTGNGRVEEYVGGYEDYVRQSNRGQPSSAAIEQSNEAQQEQHKLPQKSRAARQQNRLGYMQKRELAALPEKIEGLENEQQALECDISRGEFYQQDKEAITAALARLERIREELSQAYTRWEELDSLDG